MIIDLESIGALHPKLAQISPTRVAELAENGALALERAEHEPGAVCQLDLAGEPSTARVQWKRRGLDALEVRENKRVTEDGADAVALATLGACGWTVQRKLQPGSFADWIVVDEQGAERALEVSGTAEGDLASALRRERKQIDQAVYSAKSICVVQFAGPALVLEHR
jgi:hypothetical protein